MPRPVRPWFRFYVEAFADRKIRRLKPAQRWVWVAILGAARESHEPGSLYIAPGLPMTVRELAAYADVTEKDVTTSLTAMESMSMITRDGDLITVTNWGARQFETDDVTKRTRDHRERSRERSNNVPGNAPETETETETEEERTSSSLATETPDRFEEFWDTYSHKIGRAKAEKAYRAALKKPGVTDDLLIASAAAYITWQMSEGKHPEFTKHPTTWLHGEHWRDERPGRPAPRPAESNAQGWLRLANETAERDGNVSLFPRQIGGAS